MFSLAVAAGVIEALCVLPREGVDPLRYAAMLALGGVLAPLVSLPQAVVLLVCVRGAARLAAAGRSLRSPGWSAGVTFLACSLFPVVLYWNGRRPGLAPTLYYLGPYLLILFGAVAAALLFGLLVGVLAVRLPESLIRRIRLTGFASACGVAVFAVVIATVLIAAPEQQPNAETGARPAAAAGRPNLILISVDTLRPDHLGVYGYSKPTDPNLQRYFAQGLRFEDAVCLVPVTRPSHASMLTGLHPLNMGMRWNDRPLPPELPTLAELLRAEGYRTAAFVAGWPLVRDRSAMGRGFDLYSDRFYWGAAIHQDLANLSLLALLRKLRLVRTLERRAQGVVDDVLAWLDRDPPQPFFAWLHFYDPHSYYEAPRKHERAMGVPDDAPGSNRWLYSRVKSGERVFSEEEQRIAKALYDAEIHYVDEQLGRLFERMEAAGLDKTTVVLLTADHGEMIMERTLSEGAAFEHGPRVDEWELKVPFLLRGPGVAPGVATDRTAQLVDVMPTLLARAGVAPPPGIDGRDLLAEGGWRTRAALSVNSPGRKDPDQISVRQAGWKYEIDLGNGRETLVELDGPSAGVDLSESQPDRLSELRSAAARVKLIHHDLENLDTFEIDRLRALGYIQ